MKKCLIPLAIIAACALTQFIAGCGDGGAASDAKVSVLTSDRLPVRTAQPEQVGGPVEDNGPTTTDGPTQPPGEPGTFTGRIVFEGTAPSQTLLVRQGDPTVKDAVCRGFNIPDLSLVVNDGGVANVLIYLDEAPSGAKFEPATEPIVFDQKGCKFVPRVLLVRTGQPVKMTNTDGTSHNTHTFPARPRNPSFNQTIAPNNTTGIEYVYQDAEKQPVEVKCDIHAWMKAFHLPLDHPFAALSDDEGRFEIAGLPPGRYKFRIWHETAGFLERSYSVTIKSGETHDAGDISFAESKFASYNGPQPKQVLVSARDQ
ncbi:MAG: carboxypeptidase regulatory-like domain-containing protein [Planctomycetaceae bacterium]